MTFGAGVYTNLCGSGLTARLHWCSRECKPETGVCQAKWVQKTVCDGKLTECGENVNWGSNLGVSGNACGKTVVLNVFDHDCRENTWSCNDKNLRDYMVWYSGECGADASPSATLKPTLKPIPVVTISVTPSPSLSPGAEITPTSKPVAQTTPETGGDIVWWTVGFVIAVEAGWIIKRSARKVWK